MISRLRVLAEPIVLENLAVVFQDILGDQTVVLGGVGMTALVGPGLFLLSPRSQIAFGNACSPFCYPAIRVPPS